MEKIIELYDKKISAISEKLETDVDNVKYFVASVMKKAHNNPPFIETLLQTDLFTLKPTDITKVWLIIKEWTMGLDPRKWQDYTTKKQGIEYFMRVFGSITGKQAVEFIHSFTYRKNISLLRKEWDITSLYIPFEGKLGHKSYYGVWFLNYKPVNFIENTKENYCFG